jgi:outer membrane protein OmpA-like peptidoglycan-associated protein
MELLGGRAFVGPELQGAIDLAGSRNASPIELMIAGRMQVGPFLAGGGIGTALDRAMGAAVPRIVATVAWSPSASIAARTPVPTPPTTSASPPLVEAAPVPDPSPVAPPTPSTPPAPVAPEVAVAPAAVTTPAAATATADSAGGVRVIGPFAIDSPALPAGARAVLSDLARSAGGGAVRLIIEGHADATESERSGIVLSHMRASAVERWLVTEGHVAADLVRTRGFGASRPVVPNAADVERAQNRRVEVRIETMQPLSPTASEASTATTTEVVPADQLSSVPAARPTP